ncbi:unnamed protein product [Toxocara canis]|uniref:Uncharacterized protein n=1 Tax=Toxocara canis TaxID=6265 RepID=A0A183U7A7_TOXCA|nr:unnamed protein product [Toxocara canis]
MVTGRYGTKSGKPLVVEVEARMADEIRRRRRRDESSALTEDEESDGPHSTRDVLADEPVLGSGTTGPQFPLLFRPRTRTLSSTRSSISEVGDHCERDSLLRPEKVFISYVLSIGKNQLIMFLVA